MQTIGLLVVADEHVRAVLKVDQEDGVSHGRSSETRDAVFCRPLSEEEVVEAGRTCRHNGQSLVLLYGHY